MSQEMLYTAGEPLMLMDYLEAVDEHDMIIHLRGILRSTHQRQKLVKLLTLYHNMHNNPAKVETIPP